MAFEQQVQRSHYDFQKYVTKNHRWVSYYHQLDELFALTDVSSVLEVGSGLPIVRKIFTHHLPEICYHTLDIAQDLNPDIIGSVTDIPVEDDSYDVVCAFQVLEHLPYEQFNLALHELARVSRKHVLLSLPHFGPSFRIFIKIPLFPELRYAFKFPYPIKHNWNGQHYWEIGKRGYSPHKIRRVIEKKFLIKKEYIPFENQCHRFFVLEKI